MLAIIIAIRFLSAAIRKGSADVLANQILSFPLRPKTLQNYLKQAVSYLISHYVTKVF